MADHCNLFTWRVLLLLLNIILMAIYTCIHLYILHGVFLVFSSPFCNKFLSGVRFIFLQLISFYHTHIDTASFRAVTLCCRSDLFPHLGGSIHVQRDCTTQAIQTNKIFQFLNNWYEMKNWTQKNQPSVRLSKKI